MRHHEPGQSLLMARICQAESPVIGYITSVLGDAGDQHQPVPAKP